MSIKLEKGAAVPLTVTRVTHSCVLLDFDGSVAPGEPLQIMLRSTQAMISPRLVSLLVRW